MTRLLLRPQKGFVLLYCLFMAALLSGCISVDCKGCQKCGGGPDEGCFSHDASAQEKINFGCPNGGKICNGGGTCAGTCRTTVSGGWCMCGCQ
jgi:hypothetical protein